MDYRHDLLFGTFVTPTAAQPDRVVALAQLTEQVGLDLVTVQDHPYQARFLDTWTLLSVIAASTTTLRVAPNVANLPLRQPAVLARSVAVARPAQRRPRRARSRRRRVLGRDRGARRHAG